MGTTDTIIINRLLASIAQYKASDLHLSVGNLPSLRIDGKLTPLTSENVITGDFMNTLCAYVLNESQRKQLEERKEFVVSWICEGKARFKVHMFYQDNYLSASFRYISERIPDLASLGLPEELLSLIELPHGLVLFNGPAGSGKTTTVAVLIDAINQSQSKRILTFEDPIEYYFTDVQSIIDQREVGKDVSSFEEGIESFIREDVDVFYISKIKSKEMLESLIRLSLAGHLVFAVMDTYSTVSALEEIIDMVPPTEQSHIRAQLAENVRAIITQKLVPKLGGGRIPVVETVFSSPAIRSIIRDGELYQMHNILQTSRGEGVVSFDRSLALLVGRGIVSEEEAIRNALDKNNLRAMI